MAHLTADHVIGALQPLVYVPEYAALIPAALGLAASGDFSALYATAVAMTSGVSEQLNSALYYAVTCSEDAPRVSSGEREARLGPLRARDLAERGLDACEAWPRDPAAAVAREPVKSDVPVLILSGGLDPVTPPDNGAEVAKTLSNSRHIVAKGYGHNVSPHACVPRLIASFVDEAGFDKLPADCVKALESSARPPLWPNRLGPQP
jgi:pimeloyl-ACP methyl ester carboxylesterase